MRFRTLIILFGALLLANFLGKRDLTINLHENYYVLNWMQLIIALVTLVMAILIVAKLFKGVKNQ